jgi:hypothetical protein
LEFKDQKVQQAHKVLKAILVIQDQEDKQVHRVFRVFKERLALQDLKEHVDFKEIKV